MFRILVITISSHSLRATYIFIIDHVCICTIILTTEEKRAYFATIFHYQWYTRATFHGAQRIGKKPKRWEWKNTCATLIYNDSQKWFHIVLLTLQSSAFGTSSAYRIHNLQSYKSSTPVWCIYCIYVCSHNHCGKLSANFYWSFRTGVLYQEMNSRSKIICSMTLFNTYLIVNNAKRFSMDKCTERWRQILISPRAFSNKITSFPSSNNNW